MPTGWSTTLPTVIGDLTLLPRNIRWESNVLGVIADINRNVTTGGARYDTVFFERILREGIFRFPLGEQDDFYQLYLASRAADIYLVPDTTDMATVLNARMEDPTRWDPRNIGGPGAYQSDMQMWFDWSWIISTVAASVMIED